MQNHIATVTMLREIINGAEVIHIGTKFDKTALKEKLTATLKSTDGLSQQHVLAERALRFL